MKLKCKRMINKRIKRIKKRTLNMKNSFVLFFKEKGKMQKIKRFFIKIWRFVSDKEVFNIIVFAIPFIIMDLSTRILASDIDFFSLFREAPRLFSLAYIILFVGLIYNFKRKHGLIFYVSIFTVFYILFLVNNIYYSTTNNFFSFSLMGLASEGSKYFLDVIKSCNWLVYLIALVILLSFIFSIRYFPYNKTTNSTRIFNIIIIFLIAHFIAKSSLGIANFELTWDTWRNPRNVYNNFNDSNKCMTIAGFYEYSIRDFYVSFIKPEVEKNETESNFLAEVFSTNNDSFSKNKYTGLFKNKNVIFLQFEGIDDWLLTKEIMPNTYSLLNNSINFANHYSFYNGGGSTFNSEFAVNVGYMTPFTYPVNAYTLNKNDFPYSMANLMKANDYSIKAFHMNSNEYYSRGINYSNWGYDRYFGLVDIGDYNDTSYYLDRELVLNETFYTEIFKNEGKFINYIITYSNHMPFSNSKGVCRQLLNIDYEDELINMGKGERNEFIDSLNLTEEDCIIRQAQETDYFVKLLIQGLKDNNLYNDTIIVAFTDHYLYTASEEILDKYKDTTSNLVNKTPFFIFSKDFKKTTVTKVTSQLNILPTFLNLMGINYNEKWYVSTDALANKYQSLTIFSDLSWYDGNVYVTDGIVKNKKKITNDNLERKNNLVEYLIKKNDLVLKYDYFNEVIHY